MRRPILKCLGKAGIEVFACARKFSLRLRLRQLECSADRLVGDDFHISVNMRGGPEKWQVTGWLQIIDLQKQHEGDYTCIAQNEHGVDRATARVNVVDRAEGLYVLQYAIAVID